MTLRADARPPTHPGALLREIVLPGLRQPTTTVASALGVSRQTLYDILAERQSVTPAMAVRLGAVLGTSAESWLSMQRDLDLWRAQREVDTSCLSTLVAADN